MRWGHVIGPAQLDFTSSETGELKTPRWLLSYRPTQEKRPDNDTEDNFPPDEIGEGDSEQPAREPHCSGPGNYGVPLFIIHGLLLLKYLPLAAQMSLSVYH